MRYRNLSVFVQFAVGSPPPAVTADGFLDSVDRHDRLGTVESAPVSLSEATNTLSCSHTGGAA